MRKVWLVVVLAVTVIAFGCGAGGGAKGTAQKLVNAYKKGDVATICDHIDFKSIYDMMPAMARQNQSFEEFEKSSRKQMEDSFEEERNEEWDAQVISAEETEDTATVKMKIKAKKDAEWKEVDVPFKKIDGKWKLGLDGLAAMSGETMPETPEMPPE